MKFFCSLALCLFLGLNIWAQAPLGWHTLDKTADSHFGISLQKAYDVLQSKKSSQVIVAVIDSGIDTMHEDLKNVLWINSREIPANGKDDDNNGFIDDVIGWNFIGNKEGANLLKDSYEAERTYFKFKNKYSDSQNIRNLTVYERFQYKMWIAAKNEVKSFLSKAMNEAAKLKIELNEILKYDSITRRILKKEEYMEIDILTLDFNIEENRKVRSILTNAFFDNPNKGITNLMMIKRIRDNIDQLNQYIEKGPINYRAEIVKDNEEDISDRYYGNNIISTANSMHGTHVAGIIGAIRENFTGMDGVADNVRIMAIRIVPDGDEHDKDVALAIRYAVDNGARIINLSFGKAYSPFKRFVDEAVRYAEKKNVLIVHAAGNDAKNLDVEDNFPNPVYFDNGGKAANWITVGASGEAVLGGIAATFSNYGKEQVDVFAPGVQIYSTLPGNQYGDQQGTSMAAPVVSGIAALVLSYFPTLSAQQLKYVLEHSVFKPEELTNTPGGGKVVPLSELCKTGGIVNAFNAVKLASTLRGDLK